MHANHPYTAVGVGRLLRCAFVMAALLVVAGLPVSAAAFEVLLGTGADGTFSHHTGRTICRIVNRQATDIECRTATAASDVHNLTNLQGGSLDLALVDSRMLHDATRKKGHFQFLDIHYDNLRAIFPVYDIPVTLVARKDAGIAALDDLQGKRINIGAPRSPESLAVDTVLAAKNWTPDVFSLVQELPPSQSQDTMAFCHGTIQAMLHLGVHPDPSLKQLMHLCNADLVGMLDDDIEKLIAGHPAFSAIEIAAGTYPSDPGSLATFGTQAVLVASQDLDADTVYRIIDAIFNHQDRLKSAHPALHSFSLEKALQENLGVERHPGAARFISEH